jgi:DNA-directed RNA polymerase subunit omega
MDIVTLPIEFDEKKIDGRYRLVVAAAQRAKEILQGLYSCKTARGSQACIMALEEVISDDVEIIKGEEARRLIEIRRTNYERMIEEASVNQETGVSELSELEKDLKVYLTEKGGKEARISLDEIFENKTEE